MDPYAIRQEIEQAKREAARYENKLMMGGLDKLERLKLQTQFMRAKSKRRKLEEKLREA